MARIFFSLTRLFCKSGFSNCMVPLTLFSSMSAFGQKTFDSLAVEKAIISSYRINDSTSFDEDLLKALETTDRHFTRITDTLYGYQPLRYTVLPPVFIETDDSVFVNPLRLASRANLKSIVFASIRLNNEIKQMAKDLSKKERRKLYDHLQKNIDHFDVDRKIIVSKSVRVRYIKFPEERYVIIGIDIYGAHFVWVADRTRNWDIVKVDRLWVY